MRKSMAYGLIPVVLLLTVSLSLADGRGKGKRRPLPPPAVYTESCGTCHLAYPAWMLPAASWRTIMDGLDDHYGDKVELAAQQKDSVARWLTEQAAGTGQSRRGDKVAREQDGKPPLRVTETRWFQRKHGDIPAARIAEAKGLNNCASCHKQAEQGCFEK